MTPTPPPTIERHAARVLLLDPDDRLLLFRCQEPGAGRSFWITPGGGLEGGETHEQAARRELKEETGLDCTALGPCVWKRTHTFPWLKQTFRQHERFYLLRCDGHAVDPAQQTREELMVLAESRWWHANEIAQATREHFAPSGLSRWLLRLLREGAPGEPWDVGV
ncbi:NUDIX domain-containing protein [Phycisphaeraceae bacterium D3-23]